MRRNKKIKTKGEKNGWKSCKYYNRIILAYIKSWIPIYNTVNIDFTYMVEHR